MSYILDALRRSQAERERGQVPGLDAQPASGIPAPAAGKPGVVLWVGVGAGLGIGLLTALLAFLSMRSPPPAVAQGSSAPTASPAPSMLSPMPDSPPTAAPLPVVVSAPIRGADSASTPASARVAVTPPVAPATPGADPAPVLLAQLPPAQRRELPALAVGGVIWSENAASRFVIIDGQVVREGGSVAPGLTLERIGRSAAILRWRGFLLRLPL